MKKVRRIKSYFLKKARLISDQFFFYREDSFVSFTKKGRINITKTNISKYLYPLSVKG